MILSRGPKREQRSCLALRGVTNSVQRLYTADTLCCTSCLDHTNISPGSLQARKETKTVLWRAPRSQTYVILEMGERIVGNSVSTLLDTAFIIAMNRIHNDGDGPITRGVFELIGENKLLLNVWNSNNHQTTYGVLGAACMALVQYMTITTFGTVTFHIYDGIREVGQGQIS